MLKKVATAMLFTALAATVNMAMAQSVRTPSTIEQTSMYSSYDKQFMTTAAQANLAEIKMGNLAQGHSTNPQVRANAQHLVQDHTQSGTQLNSIAGILQVTLPTQPSARQQATYNRLSKLKGHAFDKAFVSELYNDHNKAISLFQQESQNGQNEQLKQFAASTIPALESHRDMLASTGNRLGIALGGANQPMGTSQRVVTQKQSVRGFW